MIMATADTESFSVSEAPRPVGAYVHANRVGDLLYLAGCGPRDPVTNEVPGGPIVDPATGEKREYDVGAQTHQVFDNITAVLRGAGARLEDVVDIQCFLVDLQRDFRTFNAVYAKRMEGIQATRTTIGVTSLPPNGRNIAVEFKVVARVQTSPSKSLPQQPAQGATTSAAQATPISGTLPLGDPVPGWCTRPPISIPKAGLRGRTVMLSPLDAEAHSNDLWEACSQDPHPDGRPGGFAMWTYLPCGPWNCRADFDVDIQQKAASSQFHFVAVLVPAKCSELHEQSDQKQHLLPPGTRWRAVGFASIMRVCPEMGTAEIGWVSFAPPLQRTTASTEALYLLMRHVMTLGYRRLEWKCDSLNAPSARAAQRLGFQYEGTFRQAVVYKGRNRNTSWFSILDIDWPVVDQAISSWLSTNNFDSSGQQKKGLNDFFKSKH